MVNATISAGLISNGTYITYYGVTAQRNLSMVFQNPISSTSSARSPTGITVGSGVVVGSVGTATGAGGSVGTVGTAPGTTITYYAPTFISTSMTIQSMTVLVYSSPGSIRMPEIEPNNRPFGSTLDRSQIIPLRSTNSDEHAIIMEQYKKAGSSTDTLSEVNKKIFTNSIGSNVGNTKSTKIVINSLINNYGFRTSKKRV